MSYMIFGALPCSKVSSTQPRKAPASSAKPLRRSAYTEKEASRTHGYRQSQFRTPPTGAGSEDVGAAISAPLLQSSHSLSVIADRRTSAASGPSYSKPSSHRRHELAVAASSSSSSNRW